MIIQHLVNKNTGMLYKAVNNSVLLMYYRSTKQWARACTSYSDLFVGEYLNNNFTLLNESQAEEYK